jgi:uncharacterized protein YcfJ
MNPNHPLARVLIVGIAAATLVAGCYTNDAYTGNRKVSNTAKGAGIGAAVGAIAGILTGPDARAHRKNALIAAGVGALAGGAVGQYMDRRSEAAPAARRHRRQRHA